MSHSRLPLWLLSGCVVLLAVACSGESGADSSPTKGGLTGASTCGNGVRETGEQCDDGNTVSLDGCDATCHFEQVQRINSLQLLYATDTQCPANAVGTAIKSAAQSSVQSNVDDVVKSGFLTGLFIFSGLSDLTLQQPQSFLIGGMTGTPLAADAGYHGDSDLDWWYAAAASSVDAGAPAVSMAGVADGGAVTVGPGNLAFSFPLHGAELQVSVSSVLITATVGLSSSPLEAQSAVPPGHRAAENLDPALVSFANLTNGELCGNVSAASLAGIPAPSEVLKGGFKSCSQGYTAQNSALDLMVGGCKVFFITGISSTQPDQVDPTAPPAGAGGPYQLQEDGNHHVVGCQDHTGATVDLNTCLASAAYSMASRFTTDRVIVTGVR